MELDGCHMTRGELLRKLVFPGKPTSYPRARKLGRDGSTVPWNHPFRRWRRAALEYLGRDAPLRSTICDPVIVEIAAYWPRPKDIRGPRELTMDKAKMPFPFRWRDRGVPYLGKEDIDNVTKSVLDVMQASPTRARYVDPVLADDRLVVQVLAQKWYADVGDEQRIEVAVFAVLP